MTPLQTIQFFAVIAVVLASLGLLLNFLISLIPGPDQHRVTYE